MIIWKNKKSRITAERPAIFLDRDGVVNVEEGYISTNEDLHLYDDIELCVRKIHDKGYYAIVISNQSGVARGLIQMKDLEIINDRIGRETGVDAIYCCPHHVDGIVREYATVCECRKPQIGLILQATKDYSINLSESYMVGDRASDILTGKNAGLKTVLVNTGYGIDGLEFSVNPDYVVNNVRVFIEEIL